MVKKNILFLCTGNSCRSQMAQGWTKTLHGDVFNVYSAGLEIHGLNLYAVKVMGEAGVDISTNKSKLLSELAHIEFDYVVTVCSSAYETCPIFPGNAKLVHYGFDDPPKLVPVNAGDDAKLDAFRQVRDEIKDFIETLPQSLDKIVKNP